MRIEIDKIRVGERRREDFGDIAGLAESIRQYGLLHPIVVDDEMNLVAGERRLRACQSLGWNDIEASPLGLLTDAERREIELEENEKRKDLTPYERAKNMVARVEAAAEVLRDETDSLPNLGNESKRQRGGQQKADAEKRIAERIAVPQQSINRAKHHVETADAFPFMQSPAWKQGNVLLARDQLARLPEEERPLAAALVARFAGDAGPAPSPHGGRHPRALNARHA